VAIKPQLVILGLIGVSAAQAHDPITTKLTWTQEISRIVFKRCASCHREGGAAFSLMTYDDARPWAKAIREEVLERRMPPWGAVEGVGTFRDDPSLTPVEIEMIVNWVEGGAPEGDPAYLPVKPAVPLKKENAQKRISVPQRVIQGGSELILRERVTAAAVTPRDLSNNGSMEVTAYKPDGGVEHLIWLRNYRESWTRTYWFRKAIHLPAGTRVAVYAITPSAAVISLARTPSR
jgi:hypothetical protein